MAKEHCNVAQCLIDQDLTVAQEMLAMHIRDQRGNMSRLVEQIKNKVAVKL